MKTEVEIDDMIHKVYSHMRTNIELNDDLLAEARKYSKAKTKRALVEEALSAFITLKVEEKRRAG